MGSRNAPNFCSQCGATLARGDAYCSQCGTPVGGGSARRHDASASASSTSTSTSSTSTSAADSFEAARTGGRGRDAGRNRFRRRIEDLSVEGWDVESDYGDRVVMVDRGFGSLGVHLLLVMLTGGVGNLVYGWYHYSVAADRIELREDGSERYLDGSGSGTADAVSAADSTTVGNVLLSAFVALVGLGILSSGGGVAAILFGLGLVLLGIGLFRPVRERLGERKSVSTFGTGHETEQEVVYEPSVPCTACARPVDTGVKRTYRERRYVAGVPVATSDEGENYYCRACANGDPFTGDFDDDVERANREKTREFA